MFIYPYFETPGGIQQGLYWLYCKTAIEVEWKAKGKNAICQLNYTNHHHHTQLIGHEAKNSLFIGFIYPYLLSSCFCVRGIDINSIFV